MIKLILYKIFTFLIFLKSPKYLINKDIFGLKYFIWKDTRPLDTFVRGVRVDDTSLIFFVIKLVNYFNKKKYKKYYFDVGSFIGIITLTFSKYGKNCNIHSFEPFQVSYLRQKINLSINKCNNVTLNNFAISDKNEKLLLKQNILNPGMNFLKKQNKKFKYENKTSVQANTLDNYLEMKKIKSIDILKIDAEGFDLNVLYGCRNLIKKQSIKVIFIEFLFNNKESKKIKNFLNKNNYEIFYLVRNNNTIVSSQKKYPKDSQSLLNAIALPLNSELKKILIN